MDGDVKGMLIHGEDLSVPVEDCPSCGIQCIGSNTAILGDTFIFIAFNDLKLKETNDDTDKNAMKIISVILKRYGYMAHQSLIGEKTVVLAVIY